MYQLLTGIILHLGCLQEQVVGVILRVFTWVESITGLTDLLMVV